MPLRVLLIEPPPNPNWMLYPHTPWVGVWMPNTGLLRVATQIHHAGHEVQVAEVWARRLSTADLRAWIERFKPHVVGSTATTATLISAMSFMKFAKRIDPSIATVLGGVHVTLSPAECLAGCPETDYLVLGEGELTIVELLQRIEQKWDRQQMRSVRGLGFMQGNEFVKTENRPLIENLDDLPMPKHDLLSAGSRQYRFPNVGPLLLRSPAWGVEYTRGCEFDCRFCVKPPLWRRTLRYRSEKQVVEELVLLNRKYGVKSGQLFSNDVFARRERLEELVIEMEKQKPKYAFVTFGRADTVLKCTDLLKRLVKCGMVMLWLGLESLEQKILDRIAKGTTVDLNRKVMAAAEEAQVPVIGPFFIVGFPEHSLETMRGMREEALALGPRFSPGLPAFSPTPGTAMYFEVARRGLIETFDYSEWDVGGAVCRTETMSRKEVDRESRKLGMSAVFRPSFFIEQLKNPYLHGKLQALLGFAIIFNMLAKKVSRLRVAVRRLVNRLLGRTDELEVLFDQARVATEAYARRRAEAAMAGALTPADADGCIPQPPQEPCA